MERATQRSYHGAHFGRATESPPVITDEWLADRAARSTTRVARAGSAAVRIRSAWPNRRWSPTQPASVAHRIQHLRVSSTFVRLARRQASRVRALHAREERSARPNRRWSPRSPLRERIGFTARHHKRECPSNRAARSTTRSGRSSTPSQCPRVGRRADHRARIILSPSPRADRNKSAPASLPAITSD